MDDYNPPKPIGQFKICKSGDACLHPDGPRLPATADYFHDDSLSRSGLSARCKLCKKKQAKERYTANKIKKAKFGYVYFIQSVQGGLIKIGFTGSTVENRLKLLQGASPLELYIIGHFKGSTLDEQELHKQFSHLRKHGEWFAPSQELIDFINQHESIVLVNPTQQARGEIKKRRRTNRALSPNQRRLPLKFDD